MPAEKQRLLKFAEYLTSCPKEVSDYGQCVAARAEKIKKDDCKAEFERLLVCFRKNQSKVLRK